MIVKQKLISFLVTLGCILTVLLMDKQTLIDSLSFIYLIQLVFFVYTILNQSQNRFFVFSPSFLALLYLNLNFIFGHQTVSSGVGFDIKYYDAFQKFENLHFISIYLLACNLIVYLSLDFVSLKKTSFLTSSKVYEVKNIHLYGLLAIVVILNFIKIDLSFLGGGGDFTYVFKLTTTTLFVYFASFKKGKFKYLLYGVLLLLFVVGSYDSKREILYVLILIIFLEIIQNKVNINFSIKNLFIGITTIVILVYIILVSSIMRGYGNFNVDNPIDAAGYVGNYLQSDYIGDALTANFELNTVYGNGTNAINYVYSNQVPLQYGSTFIKFMFIPIPRSIFPDKPESMIDIYTTKFAPSFRSSGGSYPVIIYAESFWNFHLLGLPFLYLLFRLINNMYIKLIKLLLTRDFSIKFIYLLFMYITIMQFIRGSGFEIWFLYGLLSLPLTFLYFNLGKSLNIIKVKK